MIAEEIREIELDPKCPSLVMSGNIQDCALFLREIAAQMAETNQHLKFIADTLYADGMVKHGQ